MSSHCRAASLLAALLAATPAWAERPEFSPQAFQIFGGMGDGGATLASTMRPEALEALKHKTVAFQSVHQPGTIIVRTAERKLYYVLSADKAEQYHVGVGREGFEWSGTNTVTRKAEWPDWRPPQSMIEREAERGHFIPEFVAGGAGNPLGARAIYIGDTQYRIHGTTQPWTIGQASSSGCIRMINEEVMDLYERVELGAKVIVE